MNIRSNAKSFFFAVGTKVQISSCLIPNYTLESVLICSQKEISFPGGHACHHELHVQFQFDSTLNVNHLLISLFVKHHCLVAFIILSLWFVQPYQRVDIYFDKKFQLKFLRGFAKRPKLTFDLAGFNLAKGFHNQKPIYFTRRVVVTPSYWVLE